MSYLDKMKMAQIYFIVTSEHCDILYVAYHCENVTLYYYYYNNIELDLPMVLDLDLGLGADLEPDNQIILLYDMFFEASIFGNFKQKQKEQA